MLVFPSVRPAVRPHVSLRKLLEDKVLAFATQSNTDTFRQELQTRDVRRVFKRYRQPLQRVFAHYAALQTHSKTLSETDFVQLLKDCQLVDAHLTPLQLKHVFAHTQLVSLSRQVSCVEGSRTLLTVNACAAVQEEEFDGDGEGGGGEDAMVYSEFLEGLAATAHHKLCSPYICMAKRVDAFISEFVLPKAHQKYRRKRTRATVNATPRSGAGT